FSVWVGLTVTRGMDASDDSFERFRRMTARSYTPVELWDAMFGSAKQTGHAFSQGGPSQWDYVRIKGRLTKIQITSKADASVLPSLIFAVDRSSEWNGITLHGHISATLQSQAPRAYERFTPG